MKRKRLTREGWGFQHFPYYQMRIESKDFRGLVGLIRLTDGHDCFWHMPRMGKVAVCGAGMTWLQIIPDGAHHVLTAKINPQGRVNVWYADVIDRIEYDDDGVAAFLDLYLDVIFSPRGDLKVDDVDELDAALAAGDVTPEQHALAVAEGEHIRRLYCRNPCASHRMCRRLLALALARLDAPDTLRRNA
ncbi:MAG: DUF402 domain-containing protein [Clostridia bacterium]|nr:DUF402 domain-containing protein [Clostridia bacterium]